MSTSDSDYSIDWLASDEEDCDSPNRLSPQHTEAHPPPSSTTSLRESPTGRHIRSGPTQSRDDGCACKNGDHRGSSGADSPAPLQPPSATPVQGFTCVGQQTPSRAFCTSSNGAVAKHHHQMRKRAHSPGLEGLEKPKPGTEKELFSQKCADLQCYVQPLSSILRGLQSGRYSERLSSFQESVAMDRIQRIMGVLQNPNMGERFLGIILKIEVMLRSWFPHVKPNVTVTQANDSTPTKTQKHNTSATPPPSSPVSQCSSDVDRAPRITDGPPANAYSATHLKWLHTSPICSLKTPEPTPGRPPAPASPPPARYNLEVTQDNAVSSSTDSQSEPLHHPDANPRLSQGPLPFKISSPCLERLLQAKDSIITSRILGDSSTSERSWMS